MDLVYVSTLEDAIRYRDQGFEPIECSFGKQSVVGPLQLDHHGVYDHHLPVCLQAYGHATRADFRSPGKYVVTGQPDADSIYALLVLERRVEPFFPIPRDIAQLDLDPVGINQTKEYFLRNPAFRMQFQPLCSLESYREALAIGQRVFDRVSLSADLVEQACAYEQGRTDRAQRAIRSLEHGVAFVVSNEDSRDVWHNDSSLVVQYKPCQSVITFSGCSEEAVSRLAAQGCLRTNVFDLLGHDGFRSFYSQLDALLGPGSGGRKTIGGSPRGKFYTEDQARQTCHLLRSITQGPRRPAA